MLENPQIFVYAIITLATLAIVAEAGILSRDEEPTRSRGDVAFDMMGNTILLIWAIWIVAHGAA